MARQYQAAPGAGFTHEQAQKYGAFLARKGLAKGPVSPEQIVEAARPETSVIHSQFEWDDEEAARMHRISQARHLVSHIMVVEQSPRGEVMSARAFHNVTTHVDGESRRGYVSSEIVWKRPELASQVHLAALQELRGWLHRYRAYSALAGIVARIEQVVIEAGEERGQEAA
jgi:hypothetical protein